MLVICPCTKALPTAVHLSFVGIYLLALVYLLVASQSRTDSWGLLCLSSVPLLHRDPLQFLCVMVIVGIEYNQLNSSDAALAIGGDKGETKNDTTKQNYR